MRSGITRRWLRGNLLLTVLLLVLVEGMFLYSYTRSYYNGVQQTMVRRFSSITGQLKMYTGDTAQKASASRSVALRRMVEQFSDKDKYEFMLLDSYGGVIASSSGTDADGIVTQSDFEQAQDAVDGMGAERAFLPAVDMADLMREKGVPLFSLESCRPVVDFDVVGITLPHELAATNVLETLDLAGIPLRTADRAEGDPIVLAGGPCAYNPEPYAPFFDVILVGEGEEQLPETLELIRELRASGTPTCRACTAGAARTRPRLPAAGRSLCSTTCRVWCTSAFSRVSPTARRSSL